MLYRTQLPNFRSIFILCFHCFLVTFSSSTSQPITYVAFCICSYYFLCYNIVYNTNCSIQLDLESVEWLEQFLIQQNIPMVIVSHDREFLDRVCTKIVDAEGGICTEYDGNYSRFLELKKGKTRHDKFDVVKSRTVLYSTHITIL